MEELKKEPETIPYIVHEAQLSKIERRERSLLLVMAGFAAALLVSNVACLIASTK